MEVDLHQGSALSRFLCLVVKDTLTSKLKNNDERWDLLFADDLVIIADTEQELQERFLAWKGALERKGFKVNIGKTELMTSSTEERRGGLLERPEMKMVRWIAEISLLERRESQDIRRTCGICNVKEKAREARFIYYGHVI
ncbi:uncharacterized protein [Macrobrachium rosenbergii]|uniref:uncharacterized protein n=1 Tax=Macrobrachium rosenbergii TaxID=79674 RepID=UPI0034D699C6